MEIRPATAGDAAAVADLYVQSAEHHVSLDPVFYHVPDQDLVLDRYVERLAQADETKGVIFVAVAGDSVVGMLEAQVGDLPKAASMVSPQRPVTIEMAIDKRHRGQGIGSGLLSRAEQWAFDLGVDVLLLDVLSSNEAAQSLYRQLGYIDHGSLLIKRRTTS